MPKQKLLEPQSFIQLGGLKANIVCQLKELADQLEKAQENALIDTPANLHLDLARFQDAPNELRILANKMNADHAGATKKLKRVFDMVVGADWVKACKTAGIQLRGGGSRG